MTDVTDAGILTTDSDVLFTGSREGHFHALDSRAGTLCCGRRASAVRFHPAR